MNSSLATLVATQPIKEVTALCLLLGDLADRSDRLGEVIGGVPAFLARADNSRELWASGLFDITTLNFMLLRYEPCEHGVQDAIVRHLLRNAIDNSLAYEIGPTDRVSHGWNLKRIRWFREKGMLRNALINRAEFIAETYKAAVVRIEVAKDEEPFRGTGFLCACNDEASGPVAIVTAKHNVDPHAGIIIEHIESASGDVFHNSSMTWHFHPELDVAAALVSRSRDKIFYFSAPAPVLSETITMGYPNVPTTSQPYMLAHRGELNAKVESYLRKGPYLLISNAISPGNSGSPVVDKLGFLLGMATEAFEANYGATPYKMQAALDGVAIEAFLQNEFGGLHSP